MLSLPLSVLDLAPVTTAAPPSRALAQSLELAQHVDRLGYRRLWVAEHHNLASIASSAPPILIDRIAGLTERIRVGSGGVMLPNHAPFVVAETFRTLEALHPGRIDLGIGRAPGTDPLTVLAVRRRQDVETEDDFLSQLHQLLAFGHDAFPADHPFARVQAMPTDVALPPIWLLGSSGFSARAAAALGLGFAFAHHFANHDAAEAMHAYRDGFRPSRFLAEPHAILAVAAVCADSAAEADRLAATIDLMWVRLMRGERAPLESPEAALALPYSDHEREQMRLNRRRLFVGTAESVAADLRAIAARTGADEIMITTMLFDPAARRRSYELLAGAFGLDRH